MANLIPTADAGVIAYGLLDELIDTLISKGVISETDRVFMFESLFSRLEKDGRSGTKSAAIALGHILKK